MPNYNIKYSAVQPVWGEIDIMPANNSGEAADFAVDEINDSFPEYSEVEIVEIIEIKS